MAVCCCLSPFVPYQCMSYHFPSRFDTHLNFAMQYFYSRINLQAPLYALGKCFLCFVDVSNPHFATPFHRNFTKSFCHCSELICTAHNLTCTPSLLLKEMSAKHFSCCSAAKFLPFLLAGIKPLAACAVSPVTAFQTAAFWFPGGATYPPGSAEQPEP